MTQETSTPVRMDDLELEAAGYKRAMPRQFSKWSLGALAFTLTCTWLGAGSSVGISLTEASSAGTLWSLPIAGCMTLVVAAGMAELVSSPQGVAGCFETTSPKVSFVISIPC
jgi:choline transport protein